VGHDLEEHATIKPEWRTHAFDLIERCQNLQWQLLTKRPNKVRPLVPDHWLRSWPTNCWLGTTVEHEGNLFRIKQLLDVPGGVPVKFLSCEPLLGPLDLSPHLGEGRINWVIVGGESGSGARLMQLDWARSIRDQCRKKGVRFFYKQPGAKAARPEDRRYVNDSVSGKKREKWLLDGRAWWQWPDDPITRGRDTNEAKGLTAHLDDKARQARRRAMERHRTEGGWEELIKRWLDPLPSDQRREAATALREAINQALKKP
jgi:protein gp37